jgi:hypothetical protein
LEMIQARKILLKLAPRTRATVFVVACHFVDSLQDIAEHAVSGSPLRELFNRRLVNWRVFKGKLLRSCKSHRC